MLYDLGTIRKASILAWKVRGDAAGLIVIIAGCKSAMEGLKQRRADLSLIIGYWGADQWDKDFQRYTRWLDLADVTARHVADQNQKGGEVTPIWKQKYETLVSEMFTGGSNAGAVLWANLANRLDQLEGAQQDLSESVHWLDEWWIKGITTAAVAVSIEYDKKQLEKEFATWAAAAKKDAKDFMEGAESLLYLVAIGAGLWFFGPLIVPMLFAGGDRRPRK